MTSRDDGSIDEELDDLSLGHRVEIGRVQSALFGEAAAPVEVGKFAIVKTLGRGAFGTVYEARDPELDRRVAIKVLAASDRRSQDKLLREAKLMATVTHPNIATVYEVGTFELAEQTKVYVAMELVEGQTLRAHVEERRPPQREIVDLMLQAGRGLAAAHQAGIVHRDFKPDNVLVGSDGRARVVDFGLASTDVDPQAALQIDDVDPTGAATRTRGAVGTPAYMAPEVFDGKRADALADQFSYCVTLYEALHGQRPFAGKTLVDLATNVARGRIADAPKGTRVSARLRRVLARGLDADPSARYPGMDALLSELAAARSTGKRQMIVAAAIATVCGVALGVAMGGRALTPVPPCALEIASIDAVWTDARANAARTAFEAVTPAYGVQSWDRVASRLEGWVERWRQAATASCEHAEPSDAGRRLRDLEAGCLERARERLDGLLATFEAATSSVVQQSVRAAAALPPPEGCLDAAALIAADPGDPERRREADRIRAELARVDTDYTAGRYDVAQSGLQTLLADAEALGFAPLVAETKAKAAQVDLKAGRYADSRSLARAAFDLAVGHGDRVTAAGAAVLLAQAGVADPTHLEAGLEWLQTGRSLLDQLDHEPRLASSLAMARASLLIVSGEATQAPRALEDAVATLRAEDEDHPDLSVALGNWGTFLLRVGRPSEAVAKYEEALQVAERTLGAGHPDAAQWLLGLGSASMTLGELDRAEDWLTRSLQQHRRAVGEAHPNTIQTLMYLGVLEHNRRDLDASIGWFDDALAAADAIDPRNDALVAEVCLRFADALSLAGDHQRAQEIAARARAIHERMFPAGDARLATVYAVGAITAARAGRRLEAVELGRRGLEVSASVGDAHPQTVNLLHETGRVLLDLDRPAEALELLDRAAAALRGGVEDPRRAALVDFDRARARAGTDPAAARRHAREALTELPADAPAQERDRIAEWLRSH